jgi:hypothetical protein
MLGVRSLPPIVCHKFLQTIYDKKKMKDVKLDESEPCNSMYCKNLSVS